MLSPIVVAISIFALFVLFNLYIRIRTFKYYRQLVQRRIEFGFKDLFSKQKWQRILDKHPVDVQLLNAFRRHMLFTGSLFVIVIIMVLILLYSIRDMNGA